MGTTILIVYLLILAGIGGAFVLFVRTNRVVGPRLDLVAAETVFLIACVGVVLWGLPLAAAALGIVEP